MDLKTYYHHISAVIIGQGSVWVFKVFVNIKNYSLHLLGQETDGGQFLNIPHCIIYAHYFFHVARNCHLYWSPMVVKLCGLLSV